MLKKQRGIFWQLYFYNAEDKGNYIEIIFNISLELVKNPAKMVQLL